MFVRSQGVSEIITVRRSRIAGLLARFLPSHIFVSSIPAHVNEVAATQNVETSGRMKPVRVKVSFARPSRPLRELFGSFHGNARTLPAVIREVAEAQRGCTGYCCSPVRRACGPGEQQARRRGRRRQLPRGVRPIPVPPFRASRILLARPKRKPPLPACVFRMGAVLAPLFSFFFVPRPHHLLVIRTESAASEGVFSPTDCFPRSHTCWRHALMRAQRRRARRGPQRISPSAFSFSFVS